MIPNFRAWDKENELIKDVVTIYLSENAVELHFQHGENPEYKQLHEAVLMQSTGIRDTNGTEIYEGDIISELSEQGEDWANHILVEVVWHKAGFYGKEKGHEPEYPITEFAKGEVIGNIYEKEVAE